MVGRPFLLTALVCVLAVPSEGLARPDLGPLSRHNFLLQDVDSWEGLSRTKFLAGIERRREQGH